MTLQLDPRQRAMLEAMQVRVWWPEQAAPASLKTPVLIADEAIAESAKDLSDASLTARVLAPAAPVAGNPARVRPGPVLAQPAAAAALAPETQDGGAMAYSLTPAQQLQVGAALAEPPAGRGACWLLVAEAQGLDPLAGEAGQLLTQMLLAMGLQQHPRLFWAGLQRSPEVEGAGGGEALASLLQQLQPTLVLAMGRLAASALLGQRAPLGQLRGQVHLCQGVPLVVTFDAPYLLRAPADKAGAWADLCLALDQVAP